MTSFYSALFNHWQEHTISAYGLWQRVHTRVGSSVCWLWHCMNSASIGSRTWSKLFSLSITWWTTSFTYKQACTRKEAGNRETVWCAWTSTLQTPFEMSTCLDHRSVGNLGGVFIRRISRTDYTLRLLNLSMLWRCPLPRVLQGRGDQYLMSIREDTIFTSTTKDYEEVK